MAKPSNQHHSVAIARSLASASNAHGRDDRTIVKSFYDGVEYIYQFVKEPATTGPQPASSPLKALGQVVFGCRSVTSTDAPRVRR